MSSAKYIMPSDGSMPFVIGGHSRKSMWKRKIAIDEMKHAIDNGIVVFERTGVSKIISDNLHVIFENETRKVYTVYRPYFFDQQGNITVEDTGRGNELAGITINVREGYGGFYLSNHTRETMEKRGIKMEELEYGLKTGIIRRERPRVLRIDSPRVQVIFCQFSNRIYTVQRPYIYNDKGEIIGKVK